MSITLIMQTIEDLKNAAKVKLDGYTDREVECFVKGALYMAGNLSQKRSEEWYRQQAERKAEGIERADEVCKLFQEATGLKRAVDSINNIKIESEVIDRAYKVLFENMLDNPEFRATMLEMLGAEDKSVSNGIIEAVKRGCKGFNELHNDIVLDFRRLKENNGEWTLMWDEALKV